MRKVDLNSYLPPVVGDAAEIREMNRVEDVELTEAWREAGLLFYNRWISTADERGLSRYEKLLGIHPEGLTSERRKVVHYEWNKFVRYTDRSVRGLFAQLLGEDGFSMEIYYDRYVVRFAVRIKGESTDLPGVYRRLRLMIPANMGIELAVETPIELSISVRYGSYKWRYIMCGEPNCGMWPYPATRGVVFGQTLGVHTRGAAREERYRLASTRSLPTPHELIYPTEARDATIVFDGGTAESMESIGKVVESGRLF